MFVEPNGPNYETSLNARVVRPQPTVSALLSSRHFVGFGGLPLGQSAYVVCHKLISADIAYMHFVSQVVMGVILDLPVFCDFCNCL